MTDRVVSTARQIAYWRHAGSAAVTAQDRRLADAELARARRQHQSALAAIYSEADEWSARRHLSEQNGTGAQP